MTFEEWWQKQGIHLEPAILEQALREIAEKGWDAGYLEGQEAAKDPRPHQPEA